MSIEEWRAVPGYEGIYEVSDAGRVRSLDRVTNDGKRLRGQSIKAFQMPTGHMRVALGRNGTKRTLKIHRLVLLAFVGPPPSGTEALHRDGDAGNNSLTNLRWGTKSENCRDQLRHGTHPWASKTHCPAGHPYDYTNTYVTPNGRSRKCRECIRTQQREAYRAERAATNERAA